MTTTSFPQLLASLLELPGDINELSSQTKSLDILPLSERSWFQLFEHKILPQTEHADSLIVSVVGGTNIGKTAIFNHLAGRPVNQVSPFASGTKHPVCLTPLRFDEATLKELFGDFTLAPLSNNQQSLEESSTDYLYYIAEENAPENLLLLDTPDIDSDAKVNWARAEKICQSSDVLIGVLTQQKYNDAAVKKFFRDAAQQGKVVCLVFNQVFLPDDEPYWPTWLETFTKETGVRPQRVYLAPHDRRAVEANRLPFYERNPSSPKTVSETPVDLREIFSVLRFAEIKLHTMLGALQELTDDKRGAQSWLSDIQLASSRYQDAAKLLSQHRLTQIDSWPNLPNRYLIGVIRNWWTHQREGWPARLHGAYDTVGRAILWPVRYATGSFTGPAKDDLAEYKQKEWSTIITIIEQVFRQLERIKEEGNPLLKARLELMLGGHSRQQILSDLHTAYQQTDLATVVQATVEEQLMKFRQESPDYYQFFRRLDTVAAAMRPATSVALFVTGVGPVSHAVSPLLFDAATQTVLHLVGDVTAGAVTAAVGETAISGSASKTAGYLEARFRKLHEKIVEQRVGWLAELLQQKFLGTLMNELTSCAELPGSPAFKKVSDRLKSLRTQLADLPATTSQPLLSDSPSVWKS
ncbi:GTPase family protein [Lacunimicrobium album]